MLSMEHENLQERPDDRAVVAKIEESVFYFLESLAAGSKKPALHVESLVAGKFNLTPRNATQFSQVTRCLADIHDMVLSNQYSTKRDLYYQNKSLYGQQPTLDRGVTKLCQLLQEQRLSLHVLSSAKGCVIGAVKWQESDGSIIDCSDRVVIVPAQVQKITNIQSSARFILVVEKDACFQKLKNERFLEKLGPCILITGKGYPDLCTRQLLKLLVNRLNIPSFALMDADPHGIEIGVTYKYGPKNCTFENRHLEIPQLQWIGVFRTEVESLPLSLDQHLPLKENEMVKIHKLKERRDLADDYLLMRELSALERSGTKLEIEAVSGIRPSFLTDCYLRDKISKLLI